MIWEPTAWDRACMAVDYWKRKYRNRLIRALGGYDQVQVSNLIHANGKLLTMRELERKAPENPLYPQMISTVERRIAEHVRSLDPYVVRNYDPGTTIVVADAERAPGR